MTIDHIGNISGHAKEILCQSTNVLRRDYLVHTDVEILGLLKGRWMILRGWRSSWNHRTNHTHTMAICLGEWMLHGLIHHELACSSALVRAVVASVVVLNPF